MKSIARFKKKILYMDLAYVDKLDQDNNGAKYLLLRQDQFVRLVDAKRVKIKESKETFRVF